LSCRLLFDQKLDRALTTFSITSPATADYEAIVKRVGDKGWAMSLAYSATAFSDSAEYDEKLADSDLLEAYEAQASVLHEQADKIAGGRTKFQVSSSAAAMAAEGTPMPFAASPVTPQLAAMTLQEWVFNQVSLGCGLLHNSVEHPPCQFWDAAAWGTFPERMSSQEAVWESARRKG
jgi:hypothetical protein